MKSFIPSMLLTILITTSPLTLKAQMIGEETPPTSTIEASDVLSDITYFVTLNAIRVRAAPADNAKVLGLLSLNDRVKIVNPDVIHNDNFIEIKVIRTVNKINSSERYFIAKDYLSETFIDYKEFSGKYFAVVNVATETLRIYERQCLDNSCPNKMLMETEVVVGEDRNHPKEEKGKGRSLLGSYRVTGWAKFYQDAEGHYPAWYRDGYPMPPAADAGWGEWFKKKYMPLDANGKTEGSMRGAFGWYAGFVAPEAYGQWTHGTIGWGADKDTYIKKTKKFLTNVVSDPRSSGCTRNNNEAIALIRQFLDTGAPIIKVYAKEALLDPSLKDYTVPTTQWDYVLTKKAGQKSDRAEVLASLKITSEELDSFWAAKMAGGELILDPKSPLNDILEVGSYTVDQKPDVIDYTPGEKMISKLVSSVGRKGNVYRIKSKDMSTGVYYVDAGFLENYTHPTAIVETSGFLDEVTPPWMDINLLLDAAE